MELPESNSHKARLAQNGGCSKRQFNALPRARKSQRIQGPRTGMLSSESRFVLLSWQDTHVFLLRFLLAGFLEARSEVCMESLDHCVERSSIWPAASQSSC